MRKPKIKLVIRLLILKIQITSNNHFAYLEDLKAEEVALIDIRNQFEFEKGHLEGALNLYAPEILNEENSTILTNLKAANKTIILYGANPNEVTVSYLLLYQLGFNNIKIASIENTYNQNQLITKDVILEKSLADIKGFINESIKKAKIEAKPIPVKIAPPKKVITVEKKKKAPAEGGC